MRFSAFFNTSKIPEIGRFLEKIRKILRCSTIFDAQTPVQPAKVLVFLQ
jgi:hypothetical protein